MTMTADALHVPDPPAVPGLTFRTGGDPSDYAVLARLLTVTHAADGIDEVVTPEGLAVEYGEDDDFDAARDLLVAAVDGDPVAFGVGVRVRRGRLLALETRGAVLPEWRHRGIGTALHRALRARLVREAASDPRDGPRELRSYAMDTEASDRALYDQEGYVPIRFGFEMRRALTSALPEHPLPDGIVLRPVAERDHRAIFDADAEAFRDHWGYRVPTEGDFRALYAHPDTDTALWCVAWDGDEVAGVVMNAIYREDNERFGVRRGWLDRVSVRRPWRGRGVAKALCAASFGVLRDAGMDEAWLGVDARNPTGALGLYEALGFTVAKRWYAYGRPLDGPAGPDWRSAEDDPEVAGATG